VEDTRAILEAGRPIGSGEPAHRRIGAPWVGVMAAEQQAWEFLAWGISMLKESLPGRAGTVDIALPSIQYLSHLPAAPVR
jgi:hypothetical protein